MMYVIGDSFSFGHNFYIEGIQDRKKIIYPTLLAEKLNVECKNLSIHGGSNWRIARILQSLPITKDDIVIIAWTSHMRFEMGCSKSQLTPNDIVIKTSDLENFENVPRVKELYPHFPVGYFVEKSDDFYYRRYFPNLLQSRFDSFLFPEKTNVHKKFAENLYGKHITKEWLEEMFAVMFSSSLYILRNSGCKFIMFNTWKNSFESKKTIFDIPEYFLGFDGNMCRFLRNRNLDFEDYWDKEEHILIADALYNYMRQIYDIQ